jgi:hypothetical protein
MAVSTRCDFMADLTPNIAYVRPVKAGRRAARELAKVNGPRYPRSLLRDHALQRRYTKTMHAVKPHEDVETLEPDHPLVRLMECPNETDTPGELSYETDMFLDLTGNAYEWAPPTRWGRATGRNEPAERWIIPSHWVWPRFGTGNAHYMVQYYEIRPWVGPGIVRIPPEEIIHYKQPSPIHKIDGWSVLSAHSEEIDAGESVDRSRFFQFKNGCFSQGAIELDAMWHDLDDQDIDRAAAKIYARLQGENNTGKPVILPPGATYNPLTIAPAEMAYMESSDQLLIRVLAAFHTPKEVAGIQDAGSEIAIYGPLLQFCRFSLAPRLRYRGAKMTREYGPRWDDSVRIWYDDPTPDNPDQLNKDMEADYRMQAIVPNEVRAIRGREPYKEGGDDPMCPMGVSPIPLNTGEDLSQFLSPAEGSRYEKDPEAGEDGDQRDAAAGGEAGGNGASEDGPAVTTGDQPDVDQDEKTADLLATVGGINGAIEILGQISSGEISADTGVQLFVLFFGISEDDARAIIGDTGERQPAQAAGEDPTASVSGATVGGAANGATTGTDSGAGETGIGEAQSGSVETGDEADLSDEEVGKLGKQFVDELLADWDAGTDEAKRRLKCGGEGGTPGRCPKPGGEAGTEQGSGNGNGKRPAKPAAANSHDAIHSAAIPKAQSWLEKAKEVPGKVMARAKAKVATVFGRFEKRYGRKTAIAIVAAGILGTAVPLPGTSFLAAAPIIGMAELYLRVSGGGQEAASKRFTNRLREEWFTQRPKSKRRRRQAQHQAQSPVFLNGEARP